MLKITESKIEEFAIKLLESQGYQYIYAPSIAPDSDTPERESFEDVLLERRLKEAVGRINPSIPTDVRSDAIVTVHGLNYLIFQELKKLVLRKICFLLISPSLNTTCSVVYFSRSIY